MNHTTKLTHAQRLKKFKAILDNTPREFNTLAIVSHTSCFNIIKELKTLNINSHQAKDIINTLENEFISLFEYNTPVHWHFYKWSKTSFVSDNFLSLLIELEKDYNLIDNKKIGYTTLY